MYGGLIVGIGPRYCPSIEDKVMRFAGKERHQIFLEPETLGGDSIYLQGMSTSLPANIQKQFIQTVDGLHNAEILRCGYAIEYDCINSLQLLPTLEYKGCKGLFFAGQVNGTSGYEEAAAQGLISGINAGLYCKNTICGSSYDKNNHNFGANDDGKQSNKQTIQWEQDGGLVLSRTNSYIGVLIDDLTTVGTNEPYRMFTARAEHRLYLRQDNADARLTPIGRAVGLADDRRWALFQEKQTQLQKIRDLITGKELERLKKPNEKLRLPHFPQSLCDIVSTEIKYAGYLAKEESKIAEIRRQENTKLPSDIDYAAVRGLRKEAQIKLNTIKPMNVGIAGRISGVTPADISVLLVYLKTKNKKNV
jgi:tRNA uridine 5-carboxymethylaminomethyl modification enzyme